MQEAQARVADGRELTPNGESPSSTPVPYRERALAVVLLVLVSPVVAVLVLLVWATMGRPVFYRGERLGRDRKPFRLIKFRTLPTDIQQRLGAWLFSEQQEVLPAVARFLRDTRLDELPQLINIIRGEMQFLGPRPERSEIYKRVIREGVANPDYETRFRQAPGILGVSQVLTPHSAPKELRARLDRRYILEGRRVGPSFVLWVLVVLSARCVALGGRYVWHNLVQMRIFRGTSERRAQPRQRPQNAWLELLDPDTDQMLRSGRIVDMNRDFLRSRFSDRLAWPYLMNYRGRISVYIGAGQWKRYKTTRCLVQQCEVLGERQPGSYDYLMGYRAESDLDRYRLDQYLLQQAIVQRR